MDNKSIRYCQLKSKWAGFLLRAVNLNAEQSMSDEFVYGLIFVQIHLTWQYPIAPSSPAMPLLSGTIERVNAVAGICILTSMEGGL